MHVAVEEARGDVAAGAVDDLVAVEVGADLDDPAVLDHHVAAAAARSCRRRRVRRRTECVSSDLTLVRGCDPSRSPPGRPAGAWSASPGALLDPRRRAPTIVLSAQMFTQLSRRIAMTLPMTPLDQRVLGSKTARRAHRPPRGRPLPGAGQPDVGRHRGAGPGRRGRPRDLRRAPASPPSACSPPAPGAATAPASTSRSASRCPAPGVRPVLLDLLGRVRPRRGVHDHRARPRRGPGQQVTSWSTTRSPARRCT